VTVQSAGRPDRLDVAWIEKTIQSIDAAVGSHSATICYSESQTDRGWFLVQSVVLLTHQGDKALPLAAPGPWY
jgi:hypothetical protein